MGEVIVAVCSFNNNLFISNLFQLPVLNQLSEYYWLAYAASTWTVPGTTAILTGRQEWENPLPPKISWSNVKWGHWDKLHSNTGVGDAQKLVDEWDGEGTAFLFYRLLHYPYGLHQDECASAVYHQRHDKLRKVYIERLKLLDHELSPLLSLRCPIVVCGDHGEDWTNTTDVRYTHHNNSSDAVLRVPFLLKNVSFPSCTLPMQTKYALEMAQGHIINHTGITIMSEGPLAAQWLLVHYYGTNKFVSSNMGIDVYKNDSLIYSGPQFSTITKRLRDLGYL